MASSSTLLGLYSEVTKNLDLQSQEFRLTAVRKDLGNLRIDDVVTSLEWRSIPGDPVLSGSMIVQRPEIGDMLKLYEGHVLKCDVKWGGVWRELFRMRLSDMQEQLDGTMSFELADDGKLLQASTDDWHFTKSSKRGKPRGWRCHEIVREVCKRYKIPMGKITAGKHYITDLHMQNATPMAVIQRAYALERANTGKRFVIRWEAGKLNILPMRRNAILYILGPQIIDAAVGKEARDEKFATAVTVRATLKGAGTRKRRKITVIVQDKKAVARNGWIHTHLAGGDVKSVAEAREKGRRYLNKHALRKRTLTSLQHPGVAFIRRGDAIRVSLPPYGYYAQHGIAFVSAGVWTLRGGDFQMSLDFVFDDPYKPAKSRRAEKDKNTRAAKREARG